MKLNKALEYIQEYVKIGFSIFPFQIKISDVWHFNHSQGIGVPFGDSSGIYIYSLPSSGSWNENPNEINEDILYIGKSNGDIGGRVWSHVGLIYEPGTKEVCIPRFKYHQWRDDENINDELKKNISDGDISVVTVKVDVPINSMIPEAIEKYLLSLCVRIDDKLPILNKGL